VSVPSPSQAAAEYATSLGRSAIHALSGATQTVTRLVEDNPLWVVAVVAVLLFLFWWSRPRTR